MHSKGKGQYQEIRPFLVNHEGCNTTEWQKCARGIIHFRVAVFSLIQYLF